MKVQRIRYPMLLIGEGLKRKLSESELAISHVDQAIEHGSGRAKACGEGLLHPMKDFFEMIDDRDDAEDPLDSHAIIALSVLTKAPVDRIMPAFA
jgi:hypothetical protein